MVRILITSGGTQAPIDPVRAITNFSTGQFGSAIAKEALLNDCEVIYLVAKQAKSPFTWSYDGLSAKDNGIDELKEFIHFCQQYRKHFKEVRFVTYDDYAATLEALILEHQPDVVVLAAAVSDYTTVEFFAEKIDSKDELIVSLKKAPKIIRQVKTWSPTIFLVGFKLLIHAPVEELISAAMQSIQSNQADLIVANNLSSIKKGQHSIYIIEPDGSFKHYTDQLANAVVKTILRKIS